MDKIVSTGWITLTNLIEGATYIYYSANADGSNPTIEPVLEGKGLSKYMGVYNGPAIKYGQPDPKDPDQLDEYNSIKEEIKWSSYVNPREASEKYRVNCNTEEIIKFVNNNEYSFSPEQIEFSVYDIEAKEVVRKPEYYISVIYLNEGKREQREVTSFFKLQPNGKVTFNIIDFIKEVENFKIEDYNKFLLYTCLKKGEGYLNFSLKYRGDLILGEIVRIRFGTTEEMAKFNVTATSINAAIRDSKMQFSEQGLDIYNGGLRIHKNTEGNSETVLWMDEETGNLVLHGDIYANNGEFNGIIRAKGGYFENEMSVFGNLSVGQSEKIYIGKKDKYQGIFSSNYSPGEGKGFFISPEGKIFANEISLGKGAEIQDYLQIGNHCFLQKPTSDNENSVISILDDSDNRIFKVTDDGKMVIGYGDNGIIANGQNSSIGSTNYAKGSSGWFLSNDEAELNNVMIRGIVKDTVFAHGEVQTVGGTLIVRPTFLIDKAYKYSDQELYVVTTKMDGTGISVGDYCQIGNKTQNEYFQIVYIERKKDNLKSEDCYYLRPIAEKSQAIEDEDIDVPQCSDNISTLGFDEKDSLITVNKKNNNGNVKLKIKEMEIAEGEEKNKSNVLYLSRNQGFEEIGIPSKLEELTFKLKNKIIAGFYEQDFSEDLEKNWAGLPLLTLATPAKDKEGKEYADNNVGIAINSSESNNYASKSISVFTQELVNNGKKRSFQRTDRIVLGDLGKGATNYCGGLTGYGLYAENVYLKGQLISESPVKETTEAERFYSGINTASDVDMVRSSDGIDYFPDQKTGKILFWSGAKDLDHIADSPFRVDSYGNLFASSGYFKGTIITEASITASTLRTATIEGYKMNGKPGTKEDPALVIKNTNHYIRFLGGPSDKDLSIKMEFNSENIKATMPLIISKGDLITDDSVILDAEGKVNAQQIILRRKESNHKILINDNSLIFGRKMDEKNIDNKHYSEIKHNFDESEMQFLALNQKIFSIDETAANIYKNLTFSKEIEFRQVKSIKNNETIGYDVYITE